MNQTCKMLEKIPKDNDQFQGQSKVKKNVKLSSNLINNNKFNLVILKKKKKRGERRRESFNAERVLDFFV